MASRKTNRKIESGRVICPICKEKMKRIGDSGWWFACENHEDLCKRITGILTRAHREIFYCTFLDIDHSSKEEFIRHFKLRAFK
jgi:hypothetical protein